MSARTYKQPSQEEVEKRRVRDSHAVFKLSLTSLQLININPETVSNVVSTDFPGHYPGEDNSWNIDSFKQVRLADLGFDRIIL
jgi:DNA-directed RNA polymerase I and III subunit RPAC1